MAMRAPSGHLIGDLFGLTFMVPPRSYKNFVQSCHSLRRFPTQSNGVVSGSLSC
jgi:hypothetical protein